MRLQNCKVKSKKCKTCPFVEGGLDLGDKKLAEIRQYLLEGQNHLCHSDRSHKTVCRGGREYQLTIWHRQGIIEEPTDEALRKAMENLGINPNSHI